MSRKGKFDFRGLGQAIKEARVARGMTREQLGEIVDLAPRYIMSIENNGQHPSLQVFYELASMFDISVDQYFYPGKAPGQTSQRRRVDKLLDGMDEADLLILEATAKGIRKAREARTAED